MSLSHRLDAYTRVVHSTRLKNIEETEKAKRVVAEERKDRKRAANDEEHLAGSRCELHPTALTQ